ncbi:PREDICTED: 39S ribosomal protein L12, mitochondrial [Ceratosolen solmsi marchali]|uniref:39S ribosomal protein L12, mitochondrial n=1 Tax=Ceratosolen solmsi marchali TaxID=326594 RepID=A0AAJ6YSQ9_9HYME|nr:PREDICTED: 39S ribosomal protein L12, mitochondrial [Ceratosolen solmsi marchali]
MNFIRIILPSTVHVRQFYKSLLHNQIQIRVANETESIKVPISEENNKPMNPKIDKIVHDITSLNLLEVAELSDLLKKRLNLPDSSILPVGNFIQKEEEEKLPQPIKSFFALKLIKYDDKQKVALIKEIKNTVPGLNLVQAKKFIESVPQIVKSDLTKDEAESLKQVLIKVGAEVIIE